MPIELLVNFTGLNGLSSQLKKLTTNSVERDEIFTQTLAVLGRQLVINLAANTPHGVTGELARSTSWRIVKTPMDEGIIHYSLEIVQTARSMEGFQYRPIVVSGRFPGLMPPPLALRGWVAHKWGLDTVQANQAAFRLATHIGRFGTSGNDYTIDTVEQSGGALQLAANSLGQALGVTISDFATI